MRSVIRLVCAAAAIAIGFAVVTLAREVQQMGFDWGGGSFSLGEANTFLIFLATLWGGGLILLAFGLLGILAAALGLKKGGGGRGLTVAVSVGVAIGIALLTAAVLWQTNPGAMQFVKILVGAGVILVVLLLISAARPRRQPGA
ncbi:MAG: hypothetical protein JXA74_17585 [Anaerolineae bacterium]|nr:hypothetical protein [Anaerolineae bacterium]